MHSIVAKKPGGVNVLQKIDFELPDLKPNDVLIKNHSIGVNFIDIYFFINNINCFNRYWK